MTNISNGITLKTVEDMVVLRKFKHYSHKSIANILGLDYDKYNVIYKTLKSLGIYQFIYKRSKNNGE